MAWFDEAVFYHIYPLGLLGAPKENDHGEVVHRLNELEPWIDHIAGLSCNALYIGPLFESVGHGYETTDYKMLDRRLGDNGDLSRFVKNCHDKGIKVIFDAVFNHTGRDFFAFKDLKEKREGSACRDWYCNVNFWGNNEYNDGFSYDNWGGYNLLVKLNQRNPEVRDYICEVIRFWVSEFDIDGLRLDAADVLDFEFMKALRRVANEVKPEFWLMGEVIHGDYSRWVNSETLHSVTNYVMNKALYSGHNDHNYFEIAHTQRRLEEMGRSGGAGFKLYNFLDNHDVERISSKLNNKAHLALTYILLYTLPGIPSIYYGSEFGIEGKKTKGSDYALRPELKLSELKENSDPGLPKLITALGKIRKENPELSYGDYRELLLTNRQYAFSRSLNGKSVIITVNNDDNDQSMTIDAGGAGEYIGALFGERAVSEDGRIRVNIKGNSGEIWVPCTDGIEKGAALDPKDISMVQGMPLSIKAEDDKKGEVKESREGIDKKTDIKEVGVIKEVQAGSEEKEGGQEIKAPSKNERSYEEGIITGLQEAVIALMEKNGPVTDQMRRDVDNNVYHDSLIAWIKSFR